MAKDILREIVQGNTGTLYKVGVTDSPSLAVNYTCNISVPSAVPPIARPVTTLLDADTRFAVQLTTDETTTLAPCEKHMMHIEIRNVVLIPEFRIEAIVEFWVLEQAIL